VRRFTGEGNNLFSLEEKNEISLKNIEKITFQLEVKMRLKD
jgi:hypothetical protein